MIDACRYLVRFAGPGGSRSAGGGRFRKRRHDGGWEAEWEGEWRPVELLQKKKTVCRKEINRRTDLLNRTFA